MAIHSSSSAFSGLDWLSQAHASDPKLTQTPSTRLPQDAAQRLQHSDDFVADSDGELSAGREFGMHPLKPPTQRGTGAPTVGENEGFSVVGEDDDCQTYNGIGDVTLRDVRGQSWSRMPSSLDESWGGQDEGLPIKNKRRLKRSCWWLTGGALAVTIGLAVGLGVHFGTSRPKAALPESAANDATPPVQNPTVSTTTSRTASPTSTRVPGILEEGRYVVTMAKQSDTCVTLNYQCPERFNDAWQFKEYASFYSLSYNEGKKSVSTGLAKQNMLNFAFPVEKELEANNCNYTVSAAFNLTLEQHDFYGTGTYVRYNPEVCVDNTSKTIAAGASCKCIFDITVA